MATQAEISSINARIDALQFEISKYKSNISRITADIAQAKAQGNFELASSQQTTLARQQQLLAETEAEVSNAWAELSAAKASTPADPPVVSAGETSGTVEPNSTANAVPTNAVPSVSNENFGNVSAPQCLASDPNYLNEQTISTQPLTGVAPQSNKPSESARNDSHLVYMYRLKSVTSTFSGGKFIQELEGTIISFNNKIAPTTTATTPSKTTATPAETKNQVAPQSALVNPMTINGVPVTDSILNQPAFNADGTMKPSADYYNKKINNGTLQPAPVYAPLAFGAGNVTPLQPQWVTIDQGMPAARPTQKIVREP